mgnify:CR=1 FL=1
MIPFIKYKNIFFGITLLILVLSVAALAAYGLKPGIEFTGGSVLEIEYQTSRPENSAIQEKIASLGLKEATIYASGDKAVIIRTHDLEPQKHSDLLKAIEETGTSTEKSFEAIGPTVGKELTDKMAVLVLISLAAMLVYIAVAFRNVPGPVSSWQYGIASFLILTHDVLVPLGIFAVLGKFQGVQITIPIITALLTVVGYAINNVIVVYDRVSENLQRDHKADFAEICNRAINQTLSRQINTSVATLLPVFAVYFWAGTSLKYFALALILGIATGTYSSVFLAAQSLVFWQQRSPRKK